MVQSTLHPYRLGHAFGSMIKKNLIQGLEMWYLMFRGLTLPLSLIPPGIFLSQASHPGLLFCEHVRLIPASPLALACSSTSQPVHTSRLLRISHWNPTSPFPNCLLFHCPVLFSSQQLILCKIVLLIYLHVYLLYLLPLQYKRHEKKDLSPVFILEPSSQQVCKYFFE